jgi:hypothetical protein
MNRPATPRDKRAAMSIVIIDLPVPGSPSRIASLPAAK